MAVQFLGSKAVTSKDKSDSPKSKQNKTDLKDIPDKFEKAGDAVNDTLDAANKTMKGATEKVGAMSVTGAGLIATLKKPFVSLSEWMKEPLRNADGTIKKEVLENGKEIILKSDKYSKNKIIGVAIAAGVLVAGIITSVIVKHVQNKKAEAQEAEKNTGKNLDVTSESDDDE